MQIRELQKGFSDLIEKLDKKQSGRYDHDVDTTLIYLLEELGELSTQIYNQKTGREKMDRELLESGICDCVALLLHLGTLYKVDVQAVFEKKKEKIREHFSI